MDIEPRLLRYFLAVADELHFGRAAARIFVSQPALSEGIKKLEQNLGVILFVRGPRHVGLTEAGKALKLQAPEILKQIERATAQFIATAQEATRRFRVGYSPFLNLKRIDRLQSRITKETDWVVEFVGGKTTELLKLLTAGDIATAVLVGPISDKQINTKLLFRERFMVGLPAMHQLVASNGIRFIEVAEEDVIWLPRSFNPTFYDWFLATCRELGYQPKFAFEVTTLQECLYLIESGKGITFMTESSKSVAQSEVIFRPLLEPISVDTLLAYRASDRSEFLRALSEIATAVFDGD